MSLVLRGTDIPDHSMPLLVELPIQRMRLHICKLLWRLGFNQGYQWGMTRLSNLPWIQVPVPDYIRSSRPTSHTLLASDLG